MYGHFDDISKHGQFDENPKHGQFDEISMTLRTRQLVLLYLSPYTRSKEEVTLCWLLDGQFSYIVICWWSRQLTRNEEDLPSASAQTEEPQRPKLTSAYNVHYIELNQHSPKTW